MVGRGRREDGYVVPVPQAGASQTRLVSDQLRTSVTLSAPIGALHASNTKPAVRSVPRTAPGALAIGLRATCQAAGSPRRFASATKSAAVFGTDSCNTWLAECRRW